MISYVDTASTSTSTRTTTSATTVPSSTPTRTSSTSTSLTNPRPCPKCVGHLRVRREDRNDYIDYRPERLLPLLRLRRENNYLAYFHDVGYNVYFLHVPKISFFPASNPKILFPHVCTLNPSPTYLCPIFYNMSSIFIIIMSSCCIAFGGFG